MVDGADQIRFDEVRETIETMYKENELLVKKPLLILQNKCDSATFSTDDISSLESVNQTSSKVTKTLSISALEGTGVAGLLDWITDTLTSKQFA